MNTYAPTADEKFHLAASAAARGPRRFARSGVVHYQSDLSSQVSFVHGTPVDAVPPDHVAWKVKSSLELFDLTELRSKSSPLGRRGFDPAHLLGPLLLGSITRVHSASEIARRLQTDSAFRLLSGGREISAVSFRTFRRTHLLFFNRCVTRTIELAGERQYLDLEQTALDSVRLEADAAGASIRTMERSEKMVKQLTAKDTSDLSPEQRERHDARLNKHTLAVKHCRDMDVTNFSTTDPLAALMKFPHGGSKPGHRLTTVVAGAAVRFCIAFYLSSKPTDHGLLRPTLEALRARMRSAGVPDDFVIKVAVDAGFCNEDDLAAAHTNALHVDVALAQQSYAGTGAVSANGMFGKDRFQINGKQVVCPAGMTMQGPHRQSAGVLKWYGIGCVKCPLHKQCTTSKARSISVNPATVQIREELQVRMQDPERKAVYDKRGPVVESMFSVLEDAMGFRRVSSRLRATSQAEIVLKVLAYNLTRLWAADAAAKKPNPDDSPDSTKAGVLLWILDTSEWPVSLVDAVIDFTLAPGGTDGQFATS